MWVVYSAQVVAEPLVIAEPAPIRRPSLQANWLTQRKRLIGLEPLWHASHSQIAAFPDRPQLHTAHIRHLRRIPNLAQQPISVLPKSSPKAPE